MNRLNLLSSIAIALCLCAGANAQTVYRIVGPDGKVTFSDKPPRTPEQGKVSTAAGTSAGAGPTSNGALPFALRQVVAKYPVVLYTTADCAPCGTGRTLLSNRGVPFSERTVTTQEDVDALKRISSDASLPFLTIGSQGIKGFSDTEWSQYLDAAGYPRTSQLPAGYRNTDASPLVVVQKPVIPSAAESPPTQPPAPVVAPPEPAASNPAGIQF